MYLYRRLDDRYEVLLLRRVQLHNGFWQPVSGAPLEGESDRDAAVREVEEETGLDASASLSPLDFGYEFAVEPQWRALYAPEVEVITEQVYAAETPPGWEPTIEPREHEEFRWCGFEEAVQLLRWPNNIEALQVLRARLSSHETGLR